MDLSKQKEPGTRIASRLSLVVEAAGIEPASENPSLWLSTSIAANLHSLAGPSSGGLPGSVASNTIMGRKRSP